MRKRVLGILLALCMIMALLPFGVLAAEDCDHQATDLNTGNSMSAISVISIAPDAESKTPGVAAEVCWKCGKVISCTVTPFADSGAICEAHQNPVAVTVQEAACEQAGLRISYCADCGTAIFGIKPTGYPAPEHSFRFTVVEKPTCGTEGWGFAQCTLCNKPYMVENLNKALLLASDSQTKEVTKLFQALRHNYRYVTESIDLNEDGEISWAWVGGVRDLFPKIAATHYETVNGQKLVQVDQDGNAIYDTVRSWTAPAETVSVPAPLDSFAVGIDNYGMGYRGDRVCANCGAVQYATDQYGEDAYLTALNDSHGCGFTDDDTGVRGYLPYFEEVDGARVYHDGVTDRCHCQRYNLTYGGNVIPYTEYFNVEYTEPNTRLVNVIEATCDAEGYTGDTYQQDDTGAWFLIKKGNPIPALGHNFVRLEDQVANCTEGGVSFTNGKVCTRCGLTQYDDYRMTPPTGHNYEWVNLVEPTCQSCGLTCQKCTVCGSLDRSSMYFTKMTEHSVVSADTAPTCTEDGYVDRTACRYCGKVFEPGTVVPAFGHSWGEWELAEPRVEDEPYVEVRTCSFCGDTEERWVTPIRIVTQPVDAVASENSTVRFNVAAEGENLSYQWQISDNGGAKWSRSSVTSAAYAAKLTAEKDGRMVRCIVSDEYGHSVTSDAATMWVGPIITTQPVDYTGVENSTARFTVAAAGDGLSYQWQVSTNGGRTWSKSSVTTANYATKLTADKDGRMVRCIVTDQAGNSVTSDPAAMNLYKLTITTQPEDYVGPVNSSATFVVGAEGEGLSYQWEISTNGGKTWSKSSVTSAVYAAKMTSEKVGRMVRCIVSDQYGNSATSDAATMHASVTITQQPVDYIGAENSNATFTVAATGEGLRYQWQVSTSAGATWSQSSVTSAKYVAKLTNEKDGRMVRCVVTDRYGNSVTSDDAAMRIGRILLHAQPVDYMGPLNSTARFTVDAIGDGLSYQWQISTNGGRTWSKSSVTSAVYAAKLTAEKDGRMVRCIVTDAYGNVVTSDPATMQVGPSITKQPVDYTGAVNSTARFTVAAAGDGLTYQWQVSTNGGRTWSQSSVKSAVYAAKLTAEKDNRLVRCIVTDANGRSITSDAASMIIK